MYILPSVKVQFFQIQTSDFRVPIANIMPTYSILNFVVYEICNKDHFRF